MGTPGKNPEKLGKNQFFSPICPKSELLRAMKDGPEHFQVSEQIKVI